MKKNKNKFIIGLQKKDMSVRWTIHMGDAITGGTIYRLADKCDAGNIVLQEMLFVDKNWDYHELWNNLFPLGVNLLVKAVELIEQSKVVEKPQEERFATWEPSWERPRLKRNEIGRASCRERVSGSV